MSREMCFYHQYPDNDIDQVVYDCESDSENKIFFDYYAITELIIWYYHQHVDTVRISYRSSIINDLNIRQSRRYVKLSDDYSIINVQNAHHVTEKGHIHEIENTIMKCYGDDNYSDRRFLTTKSARNV